MKTTARLVAGVCLLSLASAAGHVFGLDGIVFQGLGGEVKAKIDASVEAQTIDWLELVPPDERDAGPRLKDGGLPRAIVQHGQIAGSSSQEETSPFLASNDPENANIPAIARTLGGYIKLNSPPQRLADIVGGFGSLRMLQPRGGATRSDLEGKVVRIAGFMTPIKFQGTTVMEFLLVPYVGACMHVPPPPANQIVLVSGVNHDLNGGLLYPVRVTGTLRAAQTETSLATVGYKLEQATVERYD